MKKKTAQLKKWTDTFGKDYTDRNTLTPAGLADLYRKNLGVTRVAMNREFLKNIDKSSKMLEVGSNTGNQLLCLQKMGYKDLYGIEPQEYAVEFSKRRTKNLTIITGSAFDLPFKDSYFDVVFTSGVLIHIKPKDIKKVIREIYRCSKKYIWGFEYYAEKYTEIPYRNQKDLLWKTDFASLFIRMYPDLKLVKKKLFKYKANDNYDAMYLLRK